MSALLLREEEALEFKNFRYEIRGILDVEHLLHEAVILIDVEESSLHAILDRVLDELASKHKEVFDRKLIRDAMFSVDEEGCDCRIARSLHGCIKSEEELQLDESWCCILCSIDGISRRRIGIVRLKEETNLGPGMEAINLLVFVIASLKEKSTKSALETGRSFSTLLADDPLRRQLCIAPNTELLSQLILNAASGAVLHCTLPIEEDSKEQAKPHGFAAGVMDDFRKRWRYYKSDYLDGIRDMKSRSKSLSTFFFLLFTILPISIAYGMLNDENTNGIINVQKVIFGQAIGGTLFAVFGGQPMLILSTTAPLSIYIHVVYDISLFTGWPFIAFYVCVGLWAMILLATAAFFQAAHLLSYAKRSTEEMFSLFIAAALTYKAFSAIISNYITNYSDCDKAENCTWLSEMEEKCDPSSSLLYILLAFSTCFVALSFDSFRNSPFLSSWKRHLFSDYAVPLSVCAHALFAKLVFPSVPMEAFPMHSAPVMEWSTFYSLPLPAYGIAFLLAIPLSVLFFVDQLLVTKTVDNKQNKLAKGSAHHWDLLLVALINIPLSLVGLPWMHAALPSSFLHLRALADVHEKIHDGRLQPVIVHARESRVATLAAHLAMFPISIWLLPHLSAAIPTSVFQGLFFYMAIASLPNNQLWQRTLLVFTEQRAYPPSSYIRRVRQRVVHVFTLVELLQLLVLLLVGLAPLFYVEMLFPLCIALFLPIRLFVLPAFFAVDDLEALDGAH